MSHSTHTNPFHFSLLAPRHWLAWLGLGLIALIARLPYPILMRLGQGLGTIAYFAMPKRKHIARRNLELCFPELNPEQRQNLLRANLQDMGLLLVEFALAWFGSKPAIKRIPVEISGLEYLETARAAGRGVLLIGAHFSHLELAGRLLTQFAPIAGMYRQHDDRAFEWAIKHARLKYAKAMFTREQLRATVKYLRSGGIAWYAPDQDMKGKDCEFVPFFKIPAASITATHHLARLSGAAVIPFFHRRQENGSGYVLRLEAPLGNFPSNDPVGDTGRVNILIERMVREAPSQYLWIHKRFKSRPAHMPKLY